MDTLRVFIRWLESRDGVPVDVSTKGLSPNITPDQNTRPAIAEDERAMEILQYLERYEYATLPRVSIALMWQTLVRIGSIRSLALEDVNTQAQYVGVCHRPDSGTPLNSQGGGET